MSSDRARETVDDDAVAALSILESITATISESKMKSRKGGLIKIPELAFLVIASLNILCLLLLG